VRRVSLAFLATLAGCSLESTGTFDETTLDDTGIVTGDTGVPTTDSESPVDSTTTDTAVDDTTTTDTFVGDTTVTDTFKPDTSVTDTFVADTFKPDTFVPDTAVTDTFVADTFKPDTFVPDTFVPDTFVPDTFVPDTFVPDTAVTDTFVPETPATGVLSCDATAPTASVDVSLTTDGTLDWAHWGYGGLPGNWNRKSGGTALTKGPIGTPTWWGAYPTKFTWTNGTPTASVTDTTSGIYQNNKGESFAFDSAGDTAVERTLIVYVSWNGGTGTIDAKLSDSSATAATSTIPPTGVPVGTNIHPMLYTCKYRPATAGAKLQITVTQQTTGGYISLLAASLK